MIKISNLSVKFDENLVLDDVSCEIYKGKITSVIGKSGIGKSVLLKAVIGLIPQAEGEIKIDNEISTNKPKIAMLFQNSALFDSLDVFQNVAFPLFEHTKMTYQDIRELTKKTVELVNLPDILDIYPAQLSGGMRKRVALARAIIQEPDYLIYDEPTTGLDPVTADDIIKLIGTIHQKLGMTSIIITHDAECIKYLSEDIIMIDDKKIIFCDSFEKFKAFEHKTANAFKEHIFR